MGHKWVKWMVTLSVGLLIAQSGFSAEVAPTGEAPALKTEKERMSYSLGVETVRNYKRLDLGIDINLVIQGMNDAANGNKPLMSDADMKSVLIDFRAEVAAKSRGERIVAGLDNKKEADEFLAANKTKEGVVTLPSGLQYKILKAGEGKKPTAKDTVEIHYRGTLINGAEFENTYASGKPATIKISDTRIIAGLREALKLMPVGSKWQLFIPPRLAYLALGKAPAIGPNAALIFEIELLAIK